MKKTEEKGNQINKILLIVLITIIGATAVLTSVWALFSATKIEKSEMRVGKIKVDLKEDWPEEGEPVDFENPEDIYDEFGIKKYAKVVKGQSVGDLPAYVRIRCIPIVQYCYVQEGQTEGEWITAAVPQEDIVLWINGEKWIRSGDYYYYTKILEAWGTTGNLNINWQIAKIPTQIKQYNIRTDVRVVLEYAQTTNDAWKDIFKIDELPEGVEVVTQK